MVNQQNRTIFSAEMCEVHSGDDLILLVDLGVEDLFKKVRVRLRGVDTPDAHRSSSSTEAGKVRDRVKHMLLRSKCIIDVHAMKPRGWLVTLHILEDGKDPINLNGLLISEGFVYKKSRG